MTRWSENQKIFVVKMSFDGKNSKICRIPKPIVDLLGDPEKIQFKIKGKGIVIEPED